MIESKVYEKSFSEKNSKIEKKTLSLEVESLSHYYFYLQTFRHLIFNPLLNVHHKVYSLRLLINP